MEILQQPRFLLLHEHEVWHLFNYNYNADVVDLSFNIACDWCRLYVLRTFVDKLINLISFQRIFPH